MKSRLYPVVAFILGIAYPVHAQSVLRTPGDLFLERFQMERWEFDIDHDDDGLTSREEYFLGTNPRVANPPLQLGIRDENPAKVLLWDSFPGAVYQPLSSGTLSGFAPLGDTILGDGMLTELEMSPSEETRFFRLGVVAPGDIDGDGLSSVEEGLLGTDPTRDDTDGDNRKDGDEVFITFSDPLVPNLPGGTLRGTVFNDADDNGDLTGDIPLADITVYLDGNFNGQLDTGERTAETDASGNYEFLDVAPGLHHVRQVLPAPNVQTFPAGALPPFFDLLPDEVVDYVHAADGVGDFDVPYGENASEWPGEWDGIDTGPTVEIVDSLDLVLKPIGIRNVVPSRGTFNSTEFLTLPEGAEITVRFDEKIIDGPDADFFIVSGGGMADSIIDQVEVFVGTAPDSLSSIGIHDQSLGTILLDLADYGIPGPVTHVKLVSLQNGGDWKGFELTGFTAINIAPDDPDAHIVTVTAEEEIEGLDFGRYFRDLPPTIIISSTDGSPETSDIRVGESLIVQVRAFDDVGITSTSITANGEDVTLDADSRATVPAANPGAVLLEASATDTAGETVTATSIVYVRNADGSLPFDPNRTGITGELIPNAPTVRILSPPAGFVTAEDTPIIAQIVGSPVTTEWELEIAPVDLVDPYDLTTEDSDYTTIATGTGNVFSTPLGTAEISSLPDGIYFLRLCARNSEFRLACYGQVIAKNVAQEDLRPQVTITSPSAGEEIMVTAGITGTITSARPLRDWVVEIALADQVDLNNIGAASTAWKQIASGTDTLDIDSEIALIDATLLKSNSYIARVVARNDIGLGWVEPLPIEITGDVKLGRNRLEYTDVSIDLAGFPLSFTRVYDSYQADEDGELGFGWTIDLQDPDIRETVADTGTGAIFGATPFRDGTRVYITAPTGERLGFTFKPEVGASSNFGAVYKVVFEPDPGVYHTLEIPEGELAFLDLKSDGTVGLFFFDLPYNPDRYVLTDPSGNQYTYHEDRGFLRAEDPNGNTLSINPAGIRHSSGIGIDFTRDAEGRITEIAAPGEMDWAFAYNAEGELASVTDPEGRITTYSYLSDPAHYLDQITDSLGRIPSRFEYDETSGRLVAIIDQDGNRQEISWDPGSFAGSRTTPRGFVSEIEYDSRGNVTQETDPLGNVTTLTYDDPQNPDRETTMTDPEGNVTRFEYDERGNLTAYRPPASAPGSSRGVFLATYNEFGQTTYVQALDRSESTFTYDDRGNRTAVRAAYGPHYDATYSSQGIPTEVTTTPEYISQITVDENGQLAGISDTLGYSSSIITNKAGFVTSIASANGETSTFDYDSRGYPTRQTDAEGNTRTTVENTDGSFTTTDDSGIVSSVTLDASGDATNLCMPGGEDVTTTKDASRNISTVTDPIGNTFTFSYDPEERLAGIENPSGGNETYEYNSRGLLSALTTPTGKRRTFEYDVNSRIERENWIGEDSEVIRSIVFEYNQFGQLASVTDTVGEEVTSHSIFGGDVQPSRVDVTYPGQSVFRLDYSWDLARQTVAQPERVVLRQGLTPLSRIITDYIGGRAYNHTWNGGGDGVRLYRYPDGALERIERTRQFGGDSLHSQSFFTYGATGLMTSVRHEDREGNLVHPSAEISYTHDAGNRVSTITQPNDSVVVTHDAAGRLAGATHSSADYEDESYAYDVMGNRLGSHLLSGTSTVSTGNRLTAAGVFTFEYDASGNMTKRTDTVSGQVTNFAYDHRDLLSGAIVHPSEGAEATTTIALTYDYLDRLASREIDGVKTWIINDRGMANAEFRDGESTPSHTFFYALDKVDYYYAAADGDGTQSWFLNDNVGSVRGVLDAEGDFVSWTDYDTFGNFLTAPPASIVPLGYTGRSYLEPLGLYENRLRYYDPLTGRFTQQDPLGFDGGDINFYAYVGNLPLDFRDPSGTSAIEYGQLVDMTLFYVENLCKLGNCVGNLWKGVVEGTVNLTPVDPNASIEGCATSFLDIEKRLKNAVATLRGKGGGVKGKVKKIVGTVEGCSKVTFNFEASGGGGGGS